MEEKTARDKAKFHRALAWVPVLVYFVVKYLIFGNEMTRTQWISLIGAVLLAEVALWQYRRRSLSDNSPDGTH